MAKMTTNLDRGLGDPNPTAPVGRHRHSVPSGFLESLGILPAIKRGPNGEIGEIGAPDDFHEFFRSKGQERSDERAAKSDDKYRRGFVFFSPMKNAA